MNRSRAHTAAIEAPQEDLERLTAHIDAALDQAQTEGARTPAVLREIVLRPLAKKIARLDIPKQQQIEVILGAIKTFDAGWAKALVASPDTIGRLLDLLKSDGKTRIKSPRRSRPGRRAASGSKVADITRSTTLTQASAPSETRTDDGMAYHENLWGPRND